MSDSSNQDPTPQGDEASVVDAATIESLRELGGASDPNLVMDLIEMFLDDAAQRMQAMEQAWAESDLVAVSRVAHALKSSSATIGALGFAGSCKDLELSARSGENEAASLHIARCQEIFLEVQDVLQSMRASE